MSDQVCSAAVWNAARHGLDGPGIDPFEERSVPALEAQVQLVLHVSQALTDSGDLPAVSSLLTRVKRAGTGAALRDKTAGGQDVAGELGNLLVESIDGDGLSYHLREDGERWQLREYVAHRSIYHLKEADPHVWVIPRLQGRSKVALVAVEFDEFGGGRAERMHARLFADLMEELGLDAAYGACLNAAPAEMLAAANMMSMFGLHRSLRGAMVGHFAAAEITTPPSTKRIDQGLRRLGVGPRGTLFFTEHIEADAVPNRFCGTTSSATCWSGSRT
ncbi:iron-containing redox enzyme family protein [Nonomuraea sp. NPDC050547]|uniref:iron-containing redox enzyme family protein n=1 Tax=Nonomuraea sp. NPDC050547 TaxID=3364368 RepID=UPI00379C5C75